MDGLSDSGMWCFSISNVLPLLFQEIDKWGTPNVSKQSFDAVRWRSDRLGDRRQSSQVWPTKKHQNFEMTALYAVFVLINYEAVDELHQCILWHLYDRNCLNNEWI
jgi:hypothetical protein